MAIIRMREWSDEVMSDNDFVWMMALRRTRVHWYRWRTRKGLKDEAIMLSVSAGMRMDYAVLESSVLDT